MASRYGLQIIPIYKVEKQRAFWANANTTDEKGVDWEIQEIESPWFIITKNSSKSLVIKVAQNDTGQDRFFRIGLQSGNYFDGIGVSQKK